MSSGVAALPPSPTTPPSQPPASEVRTSDANAEARVPAAATRAIAKRAFASEIGEDALARPPSPTSRPRPTAALGALPLPVCCASAVAVEELAIHSSSFSDGVMSPPQLDTPKTSRAPMHSRSTARGVCLAAGATTSLWRNWATASSVSTVSAAHSACPCASVSHHPAASMSLATTTGSPIDTTKTESGGSTLVHRVPCDSVSASAPPPPTIALSPLAVSKPMSAGADCVRTCRAALL